MEASREGHLALVQLLLAAGADKEAKSSVRGWGSSRGIRCRQQQGDIGIDIRYMRRCMRGLGIMVWMLAPCAQDGEMALTEASMYGRLEVVRALLAAGADKEAKGPVGVGDCRKGESVLFIACISVTLASVGADTGTDPLCAGWLHGSHVGLHGEPAGGGASVVGCGR